MAAANIEVRLRPRGHRDELIGIEDGVLQGQKSRDKLVRVDGIEEAALVKALSAPR